MVRKHRLKITHFLVVVRKHRLKDHSFSFSPLRVELLTSEIGALLKQDIIVVDEHNLVT